MSRHLLTGALLLLLLASAGCRGMETGNEPIHPNPNMDWQPRYNAQEQSDFFDDGMTMRPPVPGTVAKGFLRENTRLYTGKTENGQFVDEVPVPVTQALLERGRERFNIFCSVCHGQAGFGQGVIMTGDYGYTPAPSYHQSTLRDTADGYIYEVITNGVRNMPGYAAQVPVADRWAIVAYIRALQRSQNAQRENVPPSVLARIEQTGSANMNAARDPSSPGGETTGGGTGGGETAEGTDAGNGDTEGGAGNDPAPADTAATGPTAAAQDTTAQQSAPESETAAPSADTAGAETASATTDAAAAPGDETGMDTTSPQTTVAEDANATGQEAAGDGTGTAAGAAEEGGGGFFGSVFSILLLVVLPIAVLCGILVVAFRKDREH